jgi:four helix bundle protein
LASSCSELELQSALTIEKRFARGAKRSFIAKCGDSLREIEESAYWLELLVESGVVSVEKLTPLRQECEELTAIFATILKRAKTS